MFVGSMGSFYNQYFITFWRFSDLCVMFSISILHPRPVDLFQFLFLARTFYLFLQGGEQYCTLLQLRFV